jgi:2-keto-3-deoxy-L-fuconate dehydrogenase
MLTDADGKRVLVAADDFMGPALCDVLAQRRAAVVRSTVSLTDRTSRRVWSAPPDRSTPSWSTCAAGATTPAAEVTRIRVGANIRGARGPVALVRAVLPAMTTRGEDLVIGSASASGHEAGIRYSAAQRPAYVRAVGVGRAPRRADQCNRQNFVDNPTYFRPKCRLITLSGQLQREVPLGRLVAAERTRVRHISADAANCFVGEVFPLCGGWVPR